MPWLAVAAEWQRDRARTEHVAELTDILKHHAAGSGIPFLWEQHRPEPPGPSPGPCQPPPLALSPFALPS